MDSSISHKPAANGLPDFRNLGVMLRILLGVNLLGLAAALIVAVEPGLWLAAYVDLSFRLQAPLLLSIALLIATRGLLMRLAWPWAQLAVLGGVLLAVWLTEDLWRYFRLTSGGPGETLRALLLAVFAVAIVLGYFALRLRAVDPAANQARLVALTARIRPHFLFNSLNAVISLIRSDPRRAESALESLADLFRVLMRDPRDLTRLSDEIELCRQYLDLEKLRLGERLRVEWTINDVPGEALVPPLILQPLLENAVYHGIEPAESGGVLKIAFSRRDQRLLIELSNPVGSVRHHAGGNQMALANIRERLSLQYDLEGRFEAGERDGVYRVRIELPYREAE